MSNQKARVFVRRDLRELRQADKNLDQLIKDFVSYINGEDIYYFGKDVPYHEPRPRAEDAGLRHIHILDKVKAVKIRRRSSDSVLVYTEGATTPNTYYFIDFLPSGAHERASSRVREPELGNLTYMEWLIKEAENFRNNF